MGLSWSFGSSKNRSYLVDTRLPFGCKKACQIFQKLSNVVARMLRDRNVTVINYLDDLLVISPTKTQNWLDLDTTINLLVTLGFEINWDKVAPPAKQMTFLGVHIDSASRTLSISSDKLSDFKALLTIWRSKKRCSKRELLSFLGRLNWICRVVFGGAHILKTPYQPL